MVVLSLTAAATPSSTLMVNVVVSVLPGATHTPMVERYLDNAPDRAALLEQFESVHPLGRIGRPDDIAAAISYLASRDADWVTGVALPVDGGFLAA